MDELPIQLDFSVALTALNDPDSPFPAKFLAAFSDLSPSKRKEFSLAWSLVPPDRKVGILEDLEDLLEKNTLMNFDEIAKTAITDEDPRVRVLAIRLLWECEESRIIPTLVDLMREDPDEAVRAASAALLGKFVLLGELETIKDEIKLAVVRNLIEVVEGNDLPQVRMRALESLGYSGHGAVEGLIRFAYESNDPLWIASALCAMGRSSDEQWESSIKCQLDSPVLEIQLESARAAGELEVESARDALLNYLDQDVDKELTFTIIWALSQIGGNDVKEKFEELLQKSSDEDEIDLLEKALENLEVTNPESFDFMDFSSTNKDSEDELDELGLDEYTDLDDEIDDDEDDY